MSGHSKFANIKHKKEKNDAAKGKIFTIIGRELAVAVKEGGPYLCFLFHFSSPDIFFIIGHDTGNGACGWGRIAWSINQ